MIKLQQHKINLQSTIATLNNTVAHGGIRIDTSYFESGWAWNGPTAKEIEGEAKCKSNRRFVYRILHPPCQPSRSPMKTGRQRSLQLTNDLQVQHSETDGMSGGGWRSGLSMWEMVSLDIDSGVGTR